MLCCCGGQELKDAGFDLNIFGFGSMKVYHANNEYASLSDLANGFVLIKTLIRMLATEEGMEAAAKRMRTS